MGRTVLIVALVIVVVAFLRGACQGPSYEARGSAPLSQIETSVTFCGIVGLRAKVLGRLGRTENSQPRACALSCPSPTIYGPGSYGAQAFIMLVCRWPRCDVPRPLKAWPFALASLCALGALRRIVGGETMTTPGG